MIYLKYRRNSSETKTRPTFFYPTPSNKDPSVLSSYQYFFLFLCCIWVWGLAGQKGSHLLSYSGIHLQTYPERFLLPSKRKNTDIPWTPAVWGFVRFGSVVCLWGEARAAGHCWALQQHWWHLWENTFGKGRDIPLQPLEEHGGAGTHTAAGRCALKELQSAGPTLKQLFSWRTAAHGGSDPHWGGERVRREKRQREAVVDWH